MMETFFTINQQTMLFLFSCLLGVVLGLLFDILRVARTLVKHEKIGVFIEDFLFISIFCLTIFTYATDQSRGDVRWFMFLGAALGFFVYFFTAGNTIVGLLRIVIKSIYTLLVKIYKKIKPIIMKILYLIFKKNNANLSKTLKK